MVFYLDEDLSEDLGRFLRAAGLDAVHTRERNLDRQRDPHQLAYAARERRTLLTANLRDFLMLHHAWLVWTRLWHDHGLGAMSHPGIIVLPNPNQLDAETMSRLIISFAGVHRAEDLQDSLWRWQPGVGWTDLSVIHR